MLTQQSNEVIPFSLNTPENLSRFSSNNAIKNKICFNNSLRTLMPWVNTNAPNFESKLYQSNSRILQQAILNIPSLILDLICSETKIHLKNGSLAFPDKTCLWTLLHEILINEDYYFEAANDSPFILDCGTHFGLSLYYFKQLYPKSQIVGFEPMPSIRTLTQQNIEDNNWSNIEIYPFALSDNEGLASFYIDPKDSMAGSLTQRRQSAQTSLKKINITCKKLSSFIDRPVDLLKMDIEGSEEAVLYEAQGQLSNIHHFFCEYHQSDTNNLARILSLLDQNHFNYPH